MARRPPNAGFSDDKARVHCPAVRGQRDAVSAPEQEELVAYATAGGGDA
jgi:hypothetical protein